MTTGYVTSKDGTTIGFHATGDGPGLVLVHGGLQTSRNFTKLAAALADRFTVYVPDRRGRGLSGPGQDYGIEQETDDLNALLDSTGVDNVFGLSSGAIVALQTAVARPEIRRLALYEPPLSFGTIHTTSWAGRFERELAAGRPAAAFATIVKGTGDSPALRFVPHFLLVPLIKLGIRADGRAGRPPEHISLGELIPTMRYDARAVGQSAGPLSRFGVVQADVLLLGGTKSARYLKAGLDGLEAVLPHVRRVTFPGVGHLAADDQGRPEVVAATLRTFFA